MKIIVLLKETIATDAKIELTRDGNIDCSQVEHIINPYDEYALEEAVSLKERFGGEVVIYTAGREEAIPNLKTALAFGGDRAVLIKMSSGADSISTASVLAAAIAQYDGDYDLILAGWVAVDDNNAQVPARLSRILKVPMVNTVTALNPEPLKKKAICHKENEDLLETVEIAIPAVIAVQKGINTPRYPSVLNIIEAKNKEIKIIEPDLRQKSKGISLTYRLPAKKRSGYIIKEQDAERAVAELIAKLQEAKAF